MKKILCILSIVTLFVTQGRSQEYLIDKISLPAVGEDFGIYVNIDVNQGINVSYDLQAYSPQQKVRAVLSSSEVNSLVSSLEKGRDIFTKWSQLAHQKNIRLLSKRIPASFADQTLYFTQEDKWYFERGVDMQAVFFVDSEGACQFILQSDYMTSKELAAQASSIGLSYSGLLNRGGVLGLSGSQSQITIGRYCGGSSLTFSSIEEINTFIKKLQSAVEWKKKNIADGKIFK